MQEQGVPKVGTAAAVHVYLLHNFRIEVKAQGTVQKRQQNQMSHGGGLADTITITTARCLSTNTQKRHFKKETDNR